MLDAGSLILVNMGSTLFFPDHVHRSRSCVVWILLRITWPKTILESQPTIRRFSNHVSGSYDVIAVWLMTALSLHEPGDKKAVSKGCSKSKSVAIWNLMKQFLHYEHFCAEIVRNQEETYALIC